MAVRVQKKTRKKVVARKRAPLKSPVKFVAAPIQLTPQTCSMKDRGEVGAVPCMSCAEHALANAASFAGLHYKRGGSSPETGFDCSGFVKHVISDSCSLHLPRTAHEQFGVGKWVNRAQLQRGDLVFFSGRHGWHVGIYAGNRKFIHSPNRRESIQVSSLDAPYYLKSYKGARRLMADVLPMQASDLLSKLEPKALGEEN